MCSSDLAVRERPYDEEFLTAALLHDVGKAVDLQDHEQESLELLDGLITHRTRWLIANHSAGRKLRDRKLPAEDRRTLRNSPDFEDLMLLVDLDQAGRVAGAQVRSLDDAIDYLRRLDDQSLWSPPSP